MQKFLANLNSWSHQCLFCTSNNILNRIHFLNKMGAAFRRWLSPHCLASCLTSPLITSLKSINLSRVWCGDKKNLEEEKLRFEVEEADVYSFGIVALEEATLLIGRKRNASIVLIGMISYLCREASSRMNGLNLFCGKK
ncbi:unnamed protein product, partial [Vitis vinifera]